MEFGFVGGQNWPTTATAQKERKERRRGGAKIS